MLLCGYYSRFTCTTGIWVSKYSCLAISHVAQFILTLWTKWENIGRKREGERRAIGIGWEVMHKLGAIEPKSGNSFYKWEESNTKLTILHGRKNRSNNCHQVTISIRSVLIELIV